MPLLKLSTLDEQGQHRTVFVERGSIQRVDFWTKPVPGKDNEPRATVWIFGARCLDVSNPVQIVALRTMCETDTVNFGQPNHVEASPLFDGGRTVEGRLNPRDEDSDD